MLGRLVVSILGASLLSGAASAQDPVKTFPNNYSVVFKNDAVTVIHAHYGPHEKVGVHDHSAFPTVYVYLSASGPVRFQHFETQTFTVDRPPVSKGAYRVAPGMIEKHTVENLGDISSDYYRVELKHVPTQAFTIFRGPAPSAPLPTGTKAEYDVPYLQVERVVCTATDKCPVEASANASLLIAFDPAARVQGAGSSFDQGGGGWSQLAARRIGYDRAVRWDDSGTLATPDPHSPRREVGLHRALSERQYAPVVDARLSRRMSQPDDSRPACQGRVTFTRGDIIPSLPRVLALWLAWIDWASPSSCFFL